MPLSAAREEKPDARKAQQRGYKLLPCYDDSDNKPPICASTTLSVLKACAEAFAEIHRASYAETQPAPTGFILDGGGCRRSSSTPSETIWTSRPQRRRSAAAAHTDRRVVTFDPFLNIQDANVPLPHM